MHIALIGDSNALFMPYLYNYLEQLEHSDAQITKITWNRFSMDDEPCDITYRDGKVGHRRGLLDYIKYSHFLIKELSKGKYDKIIVFGVPIAIFIGWYLKRYYANRYIIDIRDYHKLLKYIKFDSVVSGAEFIVVSSPEYTKWLPPQGEYVVNHNTRLKSEDCMTASNIVPRETISIAYIGASRDLEINLKLIEAAKNHPRLMIYYHGKGEIDEAIQAFTDQQSVNNLIMTGKYVKADEERLYSQSDLINVLRYDDHINNLTALPNRLYTAAYYGKPMLAFKGTYLDELISEYHLGLVIDNFENFMEQVDCYFDNFNQVAFDEGRRRFLNQAIKDNEYFNHRIKEFSNNIKMGTERD